MSHGTAKTYTTNDWLKAMRFVYPIFLILAFLVPLLGLWWAFLRARREKALSKFVAVHLKTKLMGDSPNVWGLQSAFLLLGIFMVLIAASRPQWGKASTKIITKSRNVVVAIDVSRSMLVSDVRPNRLERAKADVADLIDSLEGDRCALVAFRNTGVLVCPLTTDHGYLRGALERMTTESAPRGETDIGGAIRTSLEALDPAADDHNAIIIISDGGDLRKEAIDNAKIAAKRGVPIFTVGIGDPTKESTVPGDDGREALLYKGKQVNVKLEEAILKAVAETSNGRYVPLATASTVETTLGAIYRKFLRQVAAKEQNEEESRAADRYQMFLLPGLIFLVIGASLSKGRFGLRSKS
ncbi:MAG: VWA domain-containing protein [Kiritimatiellae bacterium]|nr:VWA domain-containing protein [Kiritimatiellia bacterium]